MHALKVYLAQGYITDDFILAWDEFVAECGVLRRVHSDRGSQLVSGADTLGLQDFDWEKISSSGKGQTI